MFLYSFGLLRCFAIGALLLLVAHMVGIQLLQNFAHSLAFQSCCQTGFYLLTRGLTDAEALALTQESFAWMAEYDGDIPGASAVECGNYLMMDPVRKPIGPT